MRPVVMVTVTDIERGMGDAVRMLNILPRLRARGEVRVVTLPGYREESFKPFGKYVYFAVRELARLLVALRVLFMSREPVYYTWDWFLARHLAWIDRIRPLDFVIEVNGLHSYEAELRGYFRRRSLMHDLYVRAAERDVCNRARGVVAVSRGFADTLARLYGIDAAAVKIVPNAADVELFQCPESRCATDTFTIGWAGSFQPYQGFSTLIDLAAMLRQAGENVRFLILGDGPARAAHESRIRELDLGDFFEFRGRIAWKDVPAALCETDCCVMIPDLSPVGREYRDAIGITQMKTYEYMALGRPIITYALGDARQVIEGNEIGFVCEPDLASFFQAVKRMMGAERETMSRNARRLAETTYNWDKSVELLADYIESMDKNRS